MERLVEFESEECPECGSQVLTVDAEDPELLTDGDAVKCEGCDGMPHGFIACDSETPVRIIWKRTMENPGPRGTETGPDAETYLMDLHRQLRDARATRSDWERAHELLDAAGVLTTPKGAMGVHLIDRLEAVLAVWRGVGQMSGASCHDLRFLCNTSEGQVEAIKAHRAAFRPADEASMVETFSQEMAEREILPGCDCPECRSGHLLDEVPGFPATKCDHCGAKFVF